MHAVLLRQLYECLSGGAKVNCRQLGVGWGEKSNEVHIYLIEFLRILSLILNGCGWFPIKLNCSGCSRYIDSSIFLSTVDIDAGISHKKVESALVNFLKLIDKKWSKNGKLTLNKCQAEEGVVDSIKYIYN